MAGSNNFNSELLESQFSTGRGGGTGIHTSGLFAHGSNNGNSQMLESIFGNVAPAGSSPGANLGNSAFVPQFNIADTGVFINGIQVEQLNGFEIRLSRGTDPHQFTVIASDGRFDNLSNPCTITIRAPGEDLVTKKEQTFKNWYVIASRAADPHRRAYDFVDIRWIANLKKLSGYYNMRWGLDDDNEGLWDTKVWTCVEAAEQAMREFGLTPDSHHDLNAASLAKILPYNLGNTEEGGFTCASMSEVFPKLLEPIRADLVITPSGHCRIVGRSFQNSAQGANGMSDWRKVGKASHISGEVGERDIEWQYPAEIVCVFPAKMEGVWTYEEPLDESGATVARPINRGNAFVQSVGTLENVIATGFNSAGGRTGEFREIREGASDLTHGILNSSNVLSHMRKYVLRPDLFPNETVPESVRNLQQYANIVISAEGLLREGWRRQFRTAFGDLARSCSRVRLGRLSDNGSTDSSGGVWMDYTIITDTWTNRRSVIESEFSRLIRGDVSESVFFAPAPFQAIWASERELVFAIIPKTQDKFVKMCIPGYLQQRIGEEMKAESIAGTTEIRKSTVRDAPEFLTGFQLAVFWNGIVVRDIGEIKRTYDVHFSIGGDGPAVYVPVADLFANWQCTKDRNFQEMLDSSRGIGYQVGNVAELEKRGNEVKDQILQTYQQDVSGIATCGGIHCISDHGVITGGPVHETIIQVGLFDPWTITTHYQFVPEFRPNYAVLDSLNGVPPERVI